MLMQRSLLTICYNRYTHLSLLLLSLNSSYTLRYICIIDTAFAALFTHCTLQADIRCEFAWKIDSVVLEIGLKCSTFGKPAVHSRSPCKFPSVAQRQYKSFKIFSIKSVLYGKVFKVENWSNWTGLYSFMRC
jgi:hypothetical protein